jgi:hypothetical protein
MDEYEWAVRGVSSERTMTSLIRHAVRSTGLTAHETRAAEAVLGREHALTRAVSNQHSLALQSLVASLAVVSGAVAVLGHIGRAPLALGIGLAVDVAFVVTWLVVRSVARERAQALIAAGNDGVVLEVVARERRRLASRAEREALASSLASLHRDALRWNQIHPHFRPLFGVGQLRHMSGEVEALVAALRRDRVRVQGVALTSRLLSDGQSSPLYANEIGPLREELNRIRFLLETGDRAVLDDGHARSAAA